MSDNTNNDIVILVQFDQELEEELYGTDDDLMEVSRFSENLPDMGELSRKAVTNALNSIKWVADEVKNLELVNRPNTMELEFGIKITTKAGIIVSGEGEFHIKAKLVWNKDS